MAMERRHPAVVAGLAGSVVALAPTTALAVGEGLPSQHDALQFGLGIVVGAAAATAVSLAVTHPREEGADEEDVAADATNELPVSRGRHARETGELGADDWARLASQQNDAQDDTGRLDHARGKAVPSAAPAAKAASEPSRAQSIAAKVPDPLADYGQIATSYTGDETLASRMARRTRSVREVLAERLGADPFDDVPVIERADGTVGDVGTSWWNSRLGDSVRHVGTLDQALASIGTWEQPTVLDVAREVDQAEVTAALLARSEGARPTDKGLGDTDSLLQMAARAPKAAAAASAPSPAVAKARATRPATPVAATPERPLTERERSERALRIARLVPEVDQGAFPEHRSTSELDEDLWDQALKAMGERMEQEAAQAQPFAGVVTADDAVGGMPAPVAAAAVVPYSPAVAQETSVPRAATEPKAAPAAKAVPDPLTSDFESPDDTIDEPEGLEPPTQFLTFRAPAGHPEVTDADSYVNYLVRDEMSRSRSKVIRSKAHDYLQLIDGGTSVSSTNRMRRTQPRTSPDATGCHHARHARADLPEAKEA